MVRVLVGFVLATMVACANASGQQDAGADGRGVIDAVIDSNNCAVQPCSILPQCGCGGQSACDVDISDNAGTACRAVTTAGTEVTVCNSLDDCDKGYICLGGAAYASCKKYCTADAECGTPRGRCVIDISSMGMLIADVPSACSSNCDPTDTSGALCPSTYKCTLFSRTHAGTSHKTADCSPAGNGVQGVNCKAGTLGADSMCAKGFMCITTDGGTNFNCRKICKKAASNCAALTCISFTEPHTIDVEYGVCN